MSDDPSVRTCRNCGVAFRVGAKPVLNCADCRRAWRVSRRNPVSPMSKARNALERIRNITRERDVREIAATALREIDP